jgi:hypothetical protein
MVDMARTQEDMQETMEKTMEPTSPQYPYGLSICFTHEELAKLGLEADCEIGDLLHMVCMARVTNVSKSEDSCRIEMQLVDIETIEDENEEFERPGADYKKFYHG